VKELFRLVRDAIVLIVRDRTTTLIFASVLMLMLWGNQGSVNLLSAVWSGWTGPWSYGNPHRARILPGIPWDQEWIAFGIGALLLFVVPALIVKLAFRERLADYGFGLPPKDKRGLALWSALLLLVVGAPGAWFAAHNPEMRALYPMFRAFSGDGQFFVYEAGYLVFFFAAEAVFRGWILFAAEKARPGTSAVFVAMLGHVVWHLGKPIPELWSTIVWSLVAGTIALGTRSLWPVVGVHWLVNVLLDGIVWKGW
jgi:hypothetical protein